MEHARRACELDSDKNCSLWLWRKRKLANLSKLSSTSKRRWIVRRTANA